MGIDQDHLVTGGTAQGEEHIAIYRSYLNVRDTKGAYKIYIGKESRRKLLTLYEKPGVVTRSLEIDLNTGTVYYDVAAGNTGSAAYFYDTANRKVDNYEISQFLRFVRPPFRPSDLEMEVFSQFPSDSWLEDLRRIPGWDQTIDEYLDSLRLPKEEVEQKEVSGKELLSPAREAVGGYTWGDLTGVMVTLRSKVSRRGWHSHFTIGRRPDGKLTLHHRNDNMGAEFFHEDEEFERYLRPADYAWILHIVKTLVAGEKLSEGEDGDGGTGRRAANMDSVRLEFGDEKFTWKPRTMAHARRMEEMLMKFLRRELEITVPDPAHLSMLDDGDVNEKIAEYEELIEEDRKAERQKSAQAGKQETAESGKQAAAGKQEKGSGERKTAAGAAMAGPVEEAFATAAGPAPGSAAGSASGATRGSIAGAASGTTTRSASGLTSGTTARTASGPASGSTTGAASAPAGTGRSVQAFLGDLHMNQATELLTRYQKQIEVIEIGPAYLLRYGLRGISKVKEDFPDKTLICDTNIIQPGGREAELALEAGADIITVMALASDQTIADCVGAAGKYNRRVMANMLGVSDSDLKMEEQTRRLRMIGVDEIGALPDTGVVETREGMALDIVKVMGLAK